MKLYREAFKILAREQVVLLDGAMGTLLQDKGLSLSPPDELNLSDPKAVQAIHKAYVSAGANIILTNTLGATKLRLASYRLGSRADEINRAGVALAREVAGEKVWVAGDIGPLGEFLEPLGTLMFDDAYLEFYRQAKSLIAEGVDLIVIETMSDLREAKAAVMASRSVFNGPILAFMTFGESGRTITGTPPEVSAVTLVAAGADVVGANCSIGAQKMVPIIRSFADNVGVPICAKPNAGLPKIVKGETLFKQTPPQFASWIPKLVNAGASIVGGCCGTTPDHIRAAAEVVKDLNPKPRKNHRGTFASRTSLIIVDAPVIVGERINPAGKSLFAEQLAKRDFGLVIDEAKAQVNAGADLIDINVGDGENADSIMAKAVCEVQNATSVPVSIDSSRPEVLEAGLKAIVGKPLLNSCPVSSRAMTEILPLARRWGSAVVGLALGSKGIPDALGQLELIEKFIDRALKEGIAIDDIYIDPVMTSGIEDVSRAFEVLRAIKRNFNVRTIAGISNISYGLPDRSDLNVAALLYAVGIGLDLVIVNPLDAQIQKAINSLSIFSQSKRRIGAQVEKVLEKGEDSKGELYWAILEGQCEKARTIVQDLKTSMKPLEIQSKFIIPALEKVNQLFEQKEYYLPQVLKASEVAQLVLKTIELDSNEELGRIVFASVAGDVHDIGKNIVIAVLRSHGFTVYDLGKNVSTSRIVSNAKKYKADIVALSALMTTTMLEMRKVAKALEENKIESKLLIGGAAVTKVYAKEIGAEYARDAVVAVDVVKHLICDKN
ncbi:MAG: dihydropteroate synthase [candidate division Zixibacteria bacterium]|nr:dihydropteroate synthase [candidate division Zixibacteria bacterium]